MNIRTTSLFSSTFFYGVIAIFVGLTDLYSQDYEEIPTGDSLFTIPITYGDSSFYYVTSGSYSQPYLILVNFLETVDGDTSLVDFLNVRVDDALMVGMLITGSGALYIYAVEFMLQLNNLAPSTSVVDSISIYTLIYNSKMSLVGGNIRDNVVLEITRDNTAVDNFLKEEDFIRLFPNPTSFEIFITVKDDFTEKPFQIFNSSGSLMRAGIIYSDRESIVIEDFPPGLYYFKIMTDGKFITKSFVVR